MHKNSQSNYHGSNEIHKRGRSSSHRSRLPREIKTYDLSRSAIPVNAFPPVSFSTSDTREKGKGERMEEALSFRVERFVSRSPEWSYSLSENFARWQKISRQEGDSPLRKLRYSLLRRSAPRCKSFNKYSSSNISLFYLSSSDTPATSPLILLGLVNSCMPCSHWISRRNYERDENVPRTLECERVCLLHCFSFDSSKFLALIFPYLSIISTSSSVDDFLI